MDRFLESDGLETGLSSRFSPSSERSPYSSSYAPDVTHEIESVLQRDLTPNKRAVIEALVSAWAGENAAQSNHSPEEWRYAS